jgi:hypothetical protein
VTRPLSPPARGWRWSALDPPPQAIHRPQERRSSTTCALLPNTSVTAEPIGGGVLSLPLVFRRRGIAFTTLAMLLLLNVPMTARPQPRPLLGEEEEKDDDDATEHYLFLLGRIGCGTMIMFAMPMMALPCREALLEVVDVWFHSSHHHHHRRHHHRHDGDDNKSEEAALASEHRRTKTTTTASSEEEEEEEGSCWRVLHRLNATETARDARVTTEDEVTEIEVEATTTTMGMEVGDDYRNDNDVIIVPRSPSVSVSVLIRTTPIQGDYVFRNTLLHYGSTLMIVGMCYLGAVSVSGVETVWSFIGSSMAFYIAFILPCGCFVAIKGAVPTRAMGGDRKEAWAILLFSVVGTVVCTVNNTLGFGH